MALFGRKKTTVGLDIGSGLIKVAVIDHSKREPELVRVTVTPLLADAIVEGEVMDPGIVADAIQAALAQRRRDDRRPSSPPSAAATSSSRKFKSSASRSSRRAS